MDELLTPVSTTYLKPRRNNDGLLLAEVRSTKKVSEPTRVSSISSADEALDVLRNQPDYDSLILVLQYLSAGGRGHEHFQLQKPGPKSATLIHLLVSEITPNYWTLLQEGSVDDSPSQGHANSQDVNLFTRCLQSGAGLSGILTHIKALIEEHKFGGRDTKRPDISLNLGIFLDLLSCLLDGDDSVRAIWMASTGTLDSAGLKKAQSQALLSILGSGRIPSLAAEALSIVDEGDLQSRARWTADGVEYSRWIGRNIASWARILKGEDAETQFCFDVFQRGMSLGYADTMVKLLIDELLLSEAGNLTAFVKVCMRQQQGAKKVFGILLQHLSQRLNGPSFEDSKPKAIISAAAGLLNSLIKDNETSKNYLINWCATASGAGLGDGVGIRRAILAVLATDKDAITTVLEKSLAQFGDQLYIKHAATLQQNVHTEILLLSAGYVSKLSPIKFRMLIRSSAYLATISNRIAATHARARFLGMVVGESLSFLIDKNISKLDFKMEETDTEEAQWLKSLTTICDHVGDITPILTKPVPIVSKQPKTMAIQHSQPKSKPKPKPAASTTIPRAIIEEVGSSEDEDDLVPYSKDSDPEDSDDDATLVQRNKLKPPVYIRDLILFLRDSESYDKQKLALQTAPPLIRRKANFGTEVSSHAEELAGLLVGVQDKFEIDDFGDLKLQGMMALIVAQPKMMAPWFARTFFEGDYSMSQRTQVLVALGLSAREIAGFDISKHQSAAAFPSKRLPEKIENLYLSSPEPSAINSSPQLKALPSTALDTITKSLTASFLAPMAAEAADAATGPDALKLETFTARYKSKTKIRPRVRAIPNTTASVIATSFFYPLTAHFQVALRSSKPIILNHALLSLYLQTLGITVNAAGPSTLSLPQLTSELWDLLLGVRVHVFGDLGAMKGWFVAMAALLEVNDGDMRKICQTQGREVMETREWVSDVFQRMRGEDGGEENDVKMLAAGILIKLGEAIEKYQALLMGDMVGFS